ncbi:MAG: hypothetical protein RBS38_12975 [Bacteroidales bacterium]|jgi:hypothetical protein|nr:hypothetical protein [Bacteroidales bacterium]
MYRKIMLLFSAGLLSVITIAQDVIIPEMKGYRIMKDYPVYKPENLWDFINGAADNYLAYGFIDLNVAEYKKGKDVIKLEIYRHSDNTMGFGIYSSERSPSFNFVDIGAQGYIAGGSINFFKGDYYVKLRTYSKKEKVLKDEETLARRVASLLPGDNAMPPVLSQFPPDGKKPNEEVYIHESVLGHSFLGKAFKAAYQTGSDEFSVFISDGNSPEEVKETAHKYIATAGTAAVETGDSKIMITDGYNGTIFLAWKDKRLVIISGLAKDQADIADRYSTEILK